MAVYGGIWKFFGENSIAIDAMLILIVRMHNFLVFGEQCIGDGHMFAFGAFGEIHVGGGYKCTTKKKGLDKTLNMKKN
jgi:hypothetical protein